MNKAKVEAIIATYLRAAAASVIALYLAGVTEPKALFSAGLAAIAGPVLKALDPKAKDFGKQAKQYSYRALAAPYRQETPLPKVITLGWGVFCRLQMLVVQVVSFQVFDVFTERLQILQCFPTLQSDVISLKIDIDLIQYLFYYECCKHSIEYI